MHFEEILIIRYNDTYYGINTEHIEQILRVRETTPLLFSPPEVKGLCAVGGNIVTAVDINLLLGLGAIDSRSPDNRLLTLNSQYGNIALLVSAVVDTMDLAPESTEWIEDSQDAVIAFHNDGKHVIQILDIGRLFVNLKVQTYGSNEIKERGLRTSDNDTLTDDSVERFLLFRMASERYAIQIDSIREIIPLLKEMTEIAKSKPEIKGMISLREELLVVADLRTYYGFEALNNEKNRILVIQHAKGKNIGLIIDEIIDIRDYKLEEIDVISETFQNSKISGIVHDSQHLVSLIGKNVLDDIFNENEKIIVSSKKDKVLAESDVVMEVAIFKLGNEEYAIDIEGVSEIIDTTHITPVANSPKYIDGIINIRGQVVTIGSLHKRLALPEMEHSEHKIVICQNGEDRIGFFVDSVSDVLEIKIDEIHDDEERGELFSNVLYLEGGERLVLLFDLYTLLTNETAA
jgi:purine-binding chemotaxis protein CheW